MLEWSGNVHKCPVHAHGHLSPPRSTAHFPVGNSTTCCPPSQSANGRFAIRLLMMSNRSKERRGANETAVPVGSERACTHETGAPVGPQRPCQNETGVPVGSERACPHETGAPVRSERACQNETGVPVGPERPCQNEKGAPVGPQRPCQNETGVPVGSGRACQHETGAAVRSQRACQQGAFPLLALFLVWRSCYGSRGRPSSRRKALCLVVAAWMARSAATSCSWVASKSISAASVAVLM